MALAARSAIARDAMAILKAALVNPPARRVWLVEPDRICYEDNAGAARTAFIRYDKGTIVLELLVTGWPI